MKILSKQIVKVVDDYDGRKNTFLKGFALKLLEYRQYIKQKMHNEFIEL